MIKVMGGPQNPEPPRRRMPAFLIGSVIFIGALCLAIVGVTIRVIFEGGSPDVGPFVTVGLIWVMWEICSGWKRNNDISKV